MNVKELRRLADIKDNSNKKIYNPDTDDFTCVFHNNKYTICALEIQEFSFHVAKHIQKHLADHLFNKRGVKVNPQADLESILEEIEVNYE